jgi:hypothetical protein
MKRVFLAVSLLLGFALSAHAITKEEAQKKVDDAKVKACEGTLKYLTAQKTCADEAAEATKVGCTVETTKDVQALNVKCSEKIKAGGAATAAAAKASSSDAKTETKAADGKSSLGKNECRALGEDGTELAKATGEYKACSDEVKAAVKTAKCTGDTKSVKIKFERGTTAPISLTVYCK